MKHIVTPFEGKHEPVALVDLIFGNFFLETDLGCYIAQPSPVPPETQLDLLPSPTSTNDLCTVGSNSSINISVGPSSCTYDVWISYFDNSKT